jgi:hypothetical protein
MIIPVYKNIEFIEDFYIERSLPSKGKILVTEGEGVFSYTKLGFSKNVAHEMVIPLSLKFNPSLKNKKFIKLGDLLAYKNSNYLFAPFDGYLEEINGGKLLVKHPEDVWLLSGVSGMVSKVVPSKSCLISSAGYKIKLFETSLEYLEGELKVLPNPSELIELDFMEKYIKNGTGQVIYTGDHLRRSMLEKAIEIGCEGLLCGSCDRETLVYARKNNFFVGILSGFGRIPTHEKVFELLKTFDSKYLVVQQDSKEIFISSPDITKNKNVLLKTPYVFLKKELRVVCLSYPYFGWEGIVLNIESDFVNVKIIRNKESIKVSSSDLIALA